MISTSNISLRVGKKALFEDVNIKFTEGNCYGLIGANGAGKTSLIKTVMGINKPASGSIWFNDLNITKEPTHSIVKNGVTCIPEGRRVFPKLTVRENLEMGCYSKRLNKNLMESQLERVYHLFPRLKERKGQLGGTLSGGEQQMLAIGRGLMNNPKLLLLDEPSLGLAPIVVDDMFEIIQKINKEEKIPVLLVEQNAYSALEISNRAYALELGHIVKSGFSQSLLRDSDIIKSYLGG